MAPMSTRALRRWLCILALAGAGDAAAQEPKTPSAPRPALKKKLKPQPLHPKKKATTAPPMGRFGIGFGLFSVYLPQPTLEALWRYADLVVSAEAGALPLAGSAYAASTTYVGLAGRYLFTPSLFAGFGLGKRRIVVTTEASVVVEEAATPIKWTRTTDQMVLTPKFGWESFGDETSLSVSLGVLLPFGTRFTTTRNVAAVAGLSDEDLAAEQEKKASDVRKITTVTSPYVEVKYGWYF